MTRLRSLLAKLASLLRRQARPQAAPARSTTAHITTSSFQRRYPGRTPTSELRHNPGWVAMTAARPHRDRRA